MKPILSAYKNYEKIWNKVDYQRLAMPARAMLAFGVLKKIKSNK
jgi:hypothetical protein